MKALLPVIALLAGLTGGIYAASQLWPAERQDAVADKSAEAELTFDEKDSQDEAKASAFLKLDQPFVIPIQTHNKISEHVVLFISMETHVDHLDALDAMTPKLRAAFIITLYDHASIGSFSDPLDNAMLAAMAQDYIDPEDGPEVLDRAETRRAAIERAARVTSLNMFGEPGSLDMPSALMMRDATFAFSATTFAGQSRFTTYFQGAPWLGFGFRYSGLENTTRNRDGLYWDRGFDFRFRVMSENARRPSVVLGLRDIGGAGLY